MTPTSPLTSLRQRWWLIPLFAVVGAMLGALAPSSSVEEQATSYLATQTMLANGTEATYISPTQVALFATVGEVPQRVADELGFEGSPAELSAQVEVNFDLNTGALTITTTQGSAEDAETLARAFGRNTNTYLTERQDQAFEQQVAASRQRVQQLEDEVNQITVEIVENPDDPLLLAQRDALALQYSLAFEQNRGLESEFNRLAFTTLEEATAVPQVDEGLSTPTARSTRAFMGLVAGGAIGAIVAILLGWLDTKIRSREQAEEITGMRARVLIPKVRMTHGGVVVRPGNQSPLSDAHRTVRNLVTFIQARLPERQGAFVTLVVSSGPGDGKTSVSANLAAAIAETGERTIVANADFRRPALHRSITGEPPMLMPYEIEELETVSISSLIEDTLSSRLKIVDFSTVDAAPGELVRGLTHRLDELREVSEQIVIDTSPLGSTAEVLDLVPYADVIVFVARVGHTSTRAMMRAKAILDDMATAPIVFVLEGIKADRTQFYEYTDQNVRRPFDPQPTGDEPALEPID